MNMRRLMLCVAGIKCVFLVQKARKKRVLLQMKPPQIKIAKIKMLSHKQRSRQHIIDTRSRS